MSCTSVPSSSAAAPPAPLVLVLMRDKVTDPVIIHVLRQCFDELEENGVQEEKLEAQY